MENIFDATGMLRRDLDKVKVAPERLGVFNALVSAVIAAEAAEAKARLKDAAVAEAVKAHDHALATQPRYSFMDEWRRMAGQAPVGAPPDPLAPAPHDILRDTEDALGQARVELRLARQAVTDARATVAKRLADYNAAVPVITPEENARQYIASEQARKQAAMDGRAPPQQRARPGKSYIDRAAFWGTHGGADDAVRSNFRNGGYRRGAFPKHMMGAINTDPRRGPVAPKMEG